MDHFFSGTLLSSLTNEKSLVTQPAIIAQRDCSSGQAKKRRDDGGRVKIITTEIAHAFATMAYKNKPRLT